jgi:hypothetical protein
VCASVVCFPRLHLTLSFSAEEAQKSVKGMEENAIHAKYIELVRYSLPNHLIIFRYTQVFSVCRVQENGARSRQGEAKAGQGQGCRSVFPFLLRAIVLF